MHFLHRFVEILAVETSFHRVHERFIVFYYVAEIYYGARSLFSIIEHSFFFSWNLIVNGVYKVLVVSSQITLRIRIMTFISAPILISFLQNALARFFYCFWDITPAIAGFAERLCTVKRRILKIFFHILLFIQLSFIFVVHSCVRILSFHFI